MESEKINGPNTGLKMSAPVERTIPQATLNLKTSMILNQ